LIEKSKTKGRKKVIAYNTLLGIGSMKKHVEYEHLELVTTYAEQLVTTNNISRSQVVVMRVVGLSS
jgi:hypothetical protein